MDRVLLVACLAVFISCTSVFVLDMTVCCFCGVCGDAYCSKHLLQVTDLQVRFVYTCLFCYVQGYLLQCGCVSPDVAVLPQTWPCLICFQKLYRGGERGGGQTDRWAVSGLLGPLGVMGGRGYTGFGVFKGSFLDARGTLGRGIVAGDTRASSV